MNIKQSVVIHRSTEDIFAYMVDVENLVDWSSAVIAVRSSSPGALQGGASMRCTMRLLGRWMETTYEVIEWHPSSHITFKSTTGIAPCVFSYQFDSIEGGSRISLEAVIHLNGRCLGLAEPVVETVVRRQVKHDLLTLKDVLDAGVTAKKRGQNNHDFPDSLSPSES